MKILVLTPRYPFPENGGDVLRINGIARYLKSKGHALCLMSFVEPEQRVDDEDKMLYDTIYTVPRNRLLSVVNSMRFFLKGYPIQCGYYYSSKFLKKMKEVLKVEKPDIQICHLLRTTRYCEILGLENNTIVEMTDALSKTYTIAQNTESFSIKKIIYKIEKSRIAKYEQKVISRFPKVVLVSWRDVDFLKKGTEGNNNALVVHTNGVEILTERPLYYDSCKICFIGNMRTLQNQDAVFRFVKGIFPLVLKEVPQAKFYVVGAQPPQKILELASDNVIVTGFVENIHDAISDSCIAVAPVQIAAGIQNKVLIAMGAGVPVVMTSLISNAIPELKDGDNCFISDDMEQFANKCVSIMKSGDLRNRLSLNGYNLVRDCYSWDEKLQGYEEI